MAVLSARRIGVTRALDYGSKRRRRQGPAAEWASDVGGNGGGPHGEALEAVAAALRGHLVAQDAVYEQVPAAAFEVACLAQAAFAHEAVADEGVDAERVVGEHLG